MSSTTAAAKTIAHGAEGFIAQKTKLSPRRRGLSPYNEWGQERYTAEEYEALRSMPCAPARNPEIEKIFDALDESFDEDSREMAEVAPLEAA